LCSDCHDDVETDKKLCRKKLIRLLGYESYDEAHLRSTKTEQEQEHNLMLLHTSPHRKEHRTLTPSDSVEERPKVGLLLEMVAAKDYFARAQIFVKLPPRCA